MPPEQNNVPINPTENSVNIKPKKNYVFLIILTALLIIAGTFGIWYFSQSSINEESENITVNKHITTSNQQQMKGIVIEQPTINMEVKLPIIVRGYINGNGWAAFEGVAGSVQVFDANNKAVSERKPLQATTDWMKFPVYFETTVGDRQTMSNLETQNGFLVFKSEEAKDESNAKEFRLPIRFAK